MEFDVVIATRNRASALMMSLPLMLSQTRLPESLIIVDSSDNHAEVKSAIEIIFGNYPRASKVQTRLVHTSPGASLQRNIGLAMVESPVVFFPDDDSLWFPGVTEAVMRAYEGDKGCRVGAVSMEESATPPIRITSKNVKYKMTTLDRVKSFYDRHFAKLEALFPPDPFLTAGRSLAGPGRLLAANMENVGNCSILTGFLMTFRTDVIRGLSGFDENLGRYSLFEDRDAGLRVLKAHSILYARSAKVFHYKSPEYRSSGYEFGVMNVLNRSYIVCKNFEQGSQWRLSLQPFLLSQVLRYGFRSSSNWGRQRLLGAFRAYCLVSQLLDLTGQELVNKYLNLKRECIPSQYSRGRQ